MIYLRIAVFGPEDYRNPEAWAGDLGPEDLKSPTLTTQHNQADYSFFTDCYGGTRMEKARYSAKSG